jgi:hypothetical protein
MSQMVFWMLGIAFSAGAMVVTVALGAHLAEFALAAIIATFIAISAVRDYAGLDGEHPSRRAASLVRHMGMLWCWAAMSISLIYGFLMQWSAWYGVFFVLVMGAGLCLFIANVLERDAAADALDSRIIGLVGLIAKVQFGATCVAVGGLVAFGKLSVDAFGGDAKWAAVNILLCMGLALAGLSGFAIAAGDSPAQSKADAPIAPVQLSPSRMQVAARHIRAA